jgi:hypothetical protein
MACNDEADHVAEAHTSTNDDNGASVGSGDHRAAPNRVDAEGLRDPAIMDGDGIVGV